MTSEIVMATLTGIMLYAAGRALANPRGNRPRSEFLYTRLARLAKFKDSLLP